jgi:hypothetical protein
VKPPTGRRSNGWRILWSLFALALVALTRLPAWEHVDQTPGRAELRFTIGSHGDAVTHILTRTRSEREMLEIGRAVAEAAFPGLVGSVRVDGNGLFAPLVDVRTEGAYIPAPDPKVTIDAGAARRAVGRFDLNQVEVWVCPAVADTTISPPRKRSVGGDCVRMNPNVVLTVTMRPQPGRWPVTLGITAGMFGLAAIGFVFLRRRPIVTIVVSGIGLATLLASIFWYPNVAEVTAAGKSVIIGSGANEAGVLIALTANMFLVELAAKRRGDGRRAEAPGAPAALVASVASSG